MNNYKIRKWTGILLAGSVFLSAAVFSREANAGIKVYPQAIESIFPDGITISEPVVLGDIQLPDLEYGSLQWKDPSYMPDFGDHLAEIVMIPYQDIDLQDAGDWNEDTGELTFEVLIHVRQENVGNVPEAGTAENAALDAMTVVPEEEAKPEEPKPEEQSPAADPVEQPEESYVDEAGAAEANHVVNGIRVSGPDLPWNVQLIVGEADSAAFTVSADAAVFQAYDFKLWNMDTDSEYQLSDQSYVTFEIPVEAGYDYKVEHLKNDGTTETIIPAYKNGTIIFSTASLSSFGVAGSTPIIGEDVAEDHYSEVTPTEAAQEQKPEGNTASDTSAPGSSSQELPAGGTASAGGLDQNPVMTSAPEISPAVSAQPTSAPSNQKYAGAVRTGDESDPAGYGMLLAFAGMGVLILVILKKKIKGQIPM